MKFHANFDINWAIKIRGKSIHEFSQTRCDTIQSSYQTMFLIHFESRYLFHTQRFTLMLTPHIFALRSLLDCLLLILLTTFLFTIHLGGLHC
jgi:hypothetical protein